MKNKGFTLLELILAMAMSSVIALGIGYLMQTSTQNYTGVQKELLLQSDAQMIMDTVSDRLLEANNAYYDPTDHLLRIYHVNAETREAYPKELVWLNTATRKMYIRVVTGTAQETDFTDAMASPTSDMERYLLAENVDSFEADQTSPDGMQGTSTVSIKIKMSLLSNKYELENTIRLRNKIWQYNSY